MHDISTNSGHRIGHQSDLDESPGQKPKAFLYGIALRVHLVFAEIGKKHFTSTNINNETLF